MRERVEYLSKAVVCILGILGIGYIAFRFLLRPILLFVIAWGIAFVARSLSEPIGRVIRIPKRYLCPGVALLMIFSLIGIVGLLLFAGVNEGIRLLSGIGEGGELSDLLGKLKDPSEIFGISIGEELSLWLGEGIGNILSQLFSTLGEWIAGFASAIPGAVVFVVIAVIATVYFSAELEHINAAVKAVLPKSAVGMLVNFKNNFLLVLLKYLKGYFSLMLITFVIMILGLTLLKVEYAVLLAALISLLDLLPVIGVGTVLIPYGLIAFAMGNTGLGVGLIVLFLVNEGVRQLAEPRILGKSLGIHPLVTLMLLYFCYSIFGAKGLLIMPILAVVINTVLVKIRPTEIK